MPEAYSAALASLLNAADQSTMTAEQRATIAAMRAGQVVVPAYLLAPAFLPEVGSSILRHAATRCIVWAQAEIAIRAAEKAQDGAQSDAMATWHHLTDWSEAERQGAIWKACTAFREVCPAANKEDQQLTFL